MGIANQLSNLGLVAYREGNFELARALQEEGLAIRQSLGDQSLIAISLTNLGEVVYRQGDYEFACSLYEQSLAIRQIVADKGCIAYSLEGIANLAASQAQLVRATRLFGAAAAFRESIGSPLPPANRAEYDQDIAAVRNALGNEAYTIAWSEGWSMTLEQAITYAMENNDDIGLRRQP